MHLLGVKGCPLGNMLMGWFIGKFGLFGVDAEVIEQAELNDVGLVLAAWWVGEGAPG